MADQIYIVGYEQNTNAQFIEGGTVVGYYDLKKLNLVWQTEFGSDQRDLVEMIKKQFKFS